jgi:hypothetical protein
MAMMGIQDPPQGKLTYTHFNLGQRIRANYPLGEKGRKREKKGTHPILFLFDPHLGSSVGL